MFPFWAPGSVRAPASDGWAALTRLGSNGLPSQPRLLPSLSSLHVSFSSSWLKLPCMPTNPCPDMRGHVPAFSRATVTQCVYQALLQQNPVQYARRRVCGKNRDRFRLKKPFCLSCEPTNLNPNILQQTYAAEASMLQQLQHKCFVFRAWFQRRKKCRQVSSYCFCQV